MSGRWPGTGGRDRRGGSEGRVTVSAWTSRTPCSMIFQQGRRAEGGLLRRFPLHHAVGAGHTAIVELLLRSVADPGQSRYTYDWWDKLLVAARERGHRRIESLLRRAMRKRFIPEDSAPRGLALYAACRRNHFEIAELLLQHGANPNGELDSCECCLTIGAICHGDRARLLQRLLRRHGAVVPPYACGR